MDWIWVGAAVIGGFALLAWSADRFVDGAASLASNAGISRLLVGFVIVGFGTSAPEMVVSAVASFGGRAGLSVGNAVGSNITNTALVLGIAALIAPIVLHKHVFRKDIPMLLGVMAIVWLMFQDGLLTRLDGAVMLVGIVLVVGWMIFDGLRSVQCEDDLDQIDGGLGKNTMSTKRAVMWIVVGLIMLPASAQGVVWGGTEIARALGVSDLVVGLTVVAFGTSLPELAASVAAALKGESELLVGNIIGSNIFNLFAVLGIAAMIDPGHIEDAVLSRDYPAMLIVTVALMLLARLGRAKDADGGGRLGRPGGAMLVAIFMAYLGWLYVSSQAVH